MMSMAPLLMHSDHVPVSVRDALRTAYAAPDAERGKLLKSAAHALSASTDLECHDVLELLGIAAECGCP